MSEYRPEEEGILVISPEKEKESPAGIDKLLQQHRDESERGLHLEINKVNIDLGEYRNRIIETLTPEIDKDEQSAKRLIELTEYNPSRLVQNSGFMRVEPIDSERSAVFPFTFENGIWRPDKDLPHFPSSQDPSLSNNYDTNILSIVRIETDQDGNINNWYQPFFSFKESLNEIDEPFAVGPDGMKDIRIKQLPNKKWAVFTRPQGNGAGNGQIGYIEINSLDELTDAINQAKIIENIFKPEEWGGVNDIIPLNEDKVGLIGHIARYNPDNQSEKEYYSTAMVYSREREQIISLRIILEARDLPYGVRGKRPDLRNVVFSGGAIQLTDGRIKISGGSGDTEAFEAIVEVEEFLRYAQGRD